MAESEEPTGTAVTPASPSRRELSPAHAAMIAERRAVNAVAQHIANLSWGKAMSAPALQATSEYCRRYGIDPAVELDILGGKLYRNAAYYIRRGAELMREGVVDDIQVIHCNVDERLAALAKRNVEGAQEELDRRELLRIKHNIPDIAPGACVVRVRIAATGVWLEGANDAGHGADPVGKADPGKTAETRAYRRVWRLLVDTLSSLKEEEARLDAATMEVTAVVSAERQRAKDLAAGQPGQRQLTAGGYGEGPAVVVEPEPASEIGGEAEPPSESSEA